MRGDVTESQKDKVAFGDREVVPIANYCTLSVCSAALADISPIPLRQGFGGQGGGELRDCPIKTKV